MKSPFPLNSQDSCCHLNFSAAKCNKTIIIKLTVSSTAASPNKQQLAINHKLFIVFSKGFIENVPQFLKSHFSASFKTVFKHLKFKSGLLFSLKFICVFYLQDVDRTDNLVVSGKDYIHRMMLLFQFSLVTFTWNGCYFSYGLFWRTTSILINFQKCLMRASGEKIRNKPCLKLIPLIWDGGGVGKKEKKTFLIEVRNFLTKTHKTKNKKSVYVFTIKGQKQNLF